MIVKQNLEHLLKAHWSEFTDHRQLMRMVLETARDAQYQTIKQQSTPPQEIKLSITKCDIKEKGLEVWAEFTIPKEDGVVIGTHILFLKFTGEYQLINTYGTFFRP